LPTRVETIPIILVLPNAIKRRFCIHSKGAGHIQAAQENPMSNILFRLSPSISRMGGAGLAAFVALAPTARAAEPVRTPIDSSVQTVDVQGTPVILGFTFANRNPNAHNDLLVAHFGPQGVVDRIVEADPIPGVEKATFISSSVQEMQRNGAFTAQIIVSMTTRNTELSPEQKQALLLKFAEHRDLCEGFVRQNFNVPRPDLTTANGTPATYQTSYYVTQAERTRPAATPAHAAPRQTAQTPRRTALSPHTRTPEVTARAATQALPEALANPAQALPDAGPMTGIPYPVAASTIVAAAPLEVRFAIPESVPGNSAALDSVLAMDPEALAILPADAPVATATAQPVRINLDLANYAPVLDNENFTVPLPTYSQDSANSADNGNQGTNPNWLMSLMLVGLTSAAGTLAFQNMARSERMARVGVWTSGAANNAGQKTAATLDGVKVWYSTTRDNSVARIQSANAYRKALSGRISHTITTYGLPVFDFAFPYNERLLEGQRQQAARNTPEALRAEALRIARLTDPSFEERDLPASFAIPSVPAPTNSSAVSPLRARINNARASVGDALAPVSHYVEIWRDNFDLAGMAMSSFVASSAIGKRAAAFWSRNGEGITDFVFPYNERALEARRQHPAAPLAPALPLGPRMVAAVSRGYASLSQNISTARANSRARSARRSAAIDAWVVRQDQNLFHVRDEVRDFFGRVSLLAQIPFYEARSLLAPRTASASTGNTTPAPAAPRAEEGRFAGIMGRTGLLAQMAWKNIFDSAGMAMSSFVASSAVGKRTAAFWSRNGEGITDFVFPYNERALEARRQHPAAPVAPALPLGPRMVAAVSRGYASLSQNISTARANSRARSARRSAAIDAWVVRQDQNLFHVRDEVRDFFGRVSLLAQIPIYEARSLLAARTASASTGNTTPAPAASRAEEGRFEDVIGRMAEIAAQIQIYDARTTVSAWRNAPRRWATNIANGLAAAGEYMSNGAANTEAKILSRKMPTIRGFERPQRLPFAAPGSSETERPVFSHFIRTAVSAPDFSIHASSRSGTPEINLADMRRAATNTSNLVDVGPDGNPSAVNGVPIGRIMSTAALQLVLSYGLNGDAAAATARSFDHTTAASVAEVPAAKTEPSGAFGFETAPPSAAVIPAVLADNPVGKLPGNDPRFAAANAGPDFEDPSGTRPPAAKDAPRLVIDNTQIAAHYNAARKEVAHYRKQMSIGRKDVSLDSVKTGMSNLRDAVMTKSADNRPSSTWAQARYLFNMRAKLFGEQDMALASRIESQLDAMMPETAAKAAKFLARNVKGRDERAVEMRKRARAYKHPSSRPALQA
jgi:hypothetical protein